MSYYKDKKIVITGGAGIVGQNLTKKLLNEGAIITSTYYNSTIQTKHDNLQTVLCDLTDINQCRNIINNCDIVINCTAYNRGAKGQSQSKTQLELIRNNVLLYINIITAAVENNIPKFGFVGSSTMYPNAVYPVTEDEGFNENPWKGYRGVGWMNRYIEQVCNFYNDISNTKFAIARTTALYGPYDSFEPENCHVIPATIMKAFNKDNPFKVWGDGNEKRNFIYVEDFIEGFLKVIELHANADPINISTSEITTVNDVVKYSIDAANYNPVIEYIDGPTMIPYRVVSTEKAETLLNWKAKTSLKDGISKTYQWYSENY